MAEEILRAPEEPEEEGLLPEYEPLFEGDVPARVAGQEAVPTGVKTLDPAADNAPISAFQTLAADRTRRATSEQRRASIQFAGAEQPSKDDWTARALQGMENAKNPSEYEMWQDVYGFTTGYVPQASESLGGMAGAGMRVPTVSPYPAPLAGFEPRPTAGYRTREHIERYGVFDENQLAVMSGEMTKEQSEALIAGVFSPENLTAYEGRFMNVALAMNRVNEDGTPFFGGVTPQDRSRISKWLRAYAAGEELNDDDLSLAEESMLRLEGEFGRRFTAGLEASKSRLGGDLFASYPMLLVQEAASGISAGVVSHEMLGADWQAEDYANVVSSYPAGMRFGLTLSNIAGSLMTLKGLHGQIFTNLRGFAEARAAGKGLGALSPSKLKTLELASSGLAMAMMRTPSAAFNEKDVSAFLKEVGMAGAIGTAAPGLDKFLSKMLSAPIHPRLKMAAVESLMDPFLTFGMEGEEITSEKLVASMLAGLAEGIVEGSTAGKGELLATAAEGKTAKARERIERYQEWKPRKQYREALRERQFKQNVKATEYARARERQALRQMERDALIFPQVEEGFLGGPGYEPEPGIPDHMGTLAEEEIGAAPQEEVVPQVQEAEVAPEPMSLREKAEAREEQTQGVEEEAPSLAEIRRRRESGEYRRAAQERIDRVEQRVRSRDPIHVLEQLARMGDIAEDTEAQQELSFKPKTSQLSVREGTKSRRELSSMDTNELRKYARSIGLQPKGKGKILRNQILEYEQGGSSRAGMIEPITSPPEHLYRNERGHLQLRGAPLEVDLNTPEGVAQAQRIWGPIVLDLQRRQLYFNRKKVDDPHFHYPFLEIKGGKIRNNENRAGFRGSSEHVSMAQALRVGRKIMEMGDGHAPSAGRIGANPPADAPNTLKVHDIDSLTRFSMAWGERAREIKTYLGFKGKKVQARLRKKGYPIYAVDADGNVYQKGKGTLKAALEAQVRMADTASDWLDYRTGDARYRDLPTESLPSAGGGETSRFLGRIMDMFGRRLKGGKANNLREMGGVIAYNPKTGRFHTEIVHEPRKDNRGRVVEGVIEGKRFEQAREKIRAAAEQESGPLAADDLVRVSFHAHPFPARQWGTYPDRKVTASAPSNMDLEFIANHLNVSGDMPFHLIPTRRGVYIVDVRAADRDALREAIRPSDPGTKPLANRVSAIYREMSEAFPLDPNAGGEAGDRATVQMYLDEFGIDTVLVEDPRQVLATMVRMLQQSPAGYAARRASVTENADRVWRKIHQDQIDKIDSDLMEEFNDPRGRYGNIMDPALADEVFQDEFDRKVAELREATFDEMVRNQIASIDWQEQHSPRVLPNLRTQTDEQVQGIIANIANNERTQTPARSQDLVDAKTEYSPPPTRMTPFNRTEAESKGYKLSTVGAQQYMRFAADRMPVIRFGQPMNTESVTKLLLYPTDFAAYAIARPMKLADDWTSNVLANVREFVSNTSIRARARMRGVTTKTGQIREIIKAKEKKGQPSWLRRGSEYISYLREYWGQQDASRWKASLLNSDMNTNDKGEELTPVQHALAVDTLQMVGQATPEQAAQAYKDVEQQLGKRYAHRLKQIRRMFDGYHDDLYRLGFITQGQHRRMKGRYTTRAYDAFLSGELEGDNAFPAPVGSRRGPTIGKRKDLSFEKREELGERTDINEIVSDTMMKQGALVASAQLFDSVSKNAAMSMSKSEWIAAGRPKTFHDRPLPTGEGWGHLRGKYVHKSLYADLKGRMDEDPQGLVHAAARWADEFVKDWKYSRTVLNPGTQMRNILGNSTLAWFDGISYTNPRNWQYFKPVLELMQGARDIDSPWATEYEYLLRNRIIGTDFATSEMGDLLDSLGKVEPEFFETLFRRPHEAVMSLPGVKNLKGVLEKVYMLADTMPKVASFMKKVDSGMAPEQAVEEILQRWPSYETAWVSRIAHENTTSGRFVRRLMPPFMSFTSEMARIISGYAVDKPISLGMFSAMLFGVNKVMWDMLDLPEEERDAWENFSPHYRRPGLLNIPLPFRDSKGNLQLVDLTYSLAMGSEIRDFIDFFDKKVLGNEIFWEQDSISLIFQDPLMRAALGAFANVDDFTNRQLDTSVTPSSFRSEPSGIGFRNRVNYALSSLLSPWTPGMELFGQSDTFFDGGYNFRKWMQAARGDPLSWRPQGPRTVTEVALQTILGINIRVSDTDEDTQRALVGANGLIEAKLNDLTAYLTGDDGFDADKAQSRIAGSMDDIVEIRNSVARGLGLPEIEHRSELPDTITNRLKDKVLRRATSTNRSRSLGGLNATFDD